MDWIDYDQECNGCARCEHSWRIISRKARTTEITDNLRDRYVDDWSCHARGGRESRYESRGTM